jgi:hypothetical protein
MQKQKNETRNQYQPPDLDATTTKSTLRKIYQKSKAVMINNAVLKSNDHYNCFQSQQATTPRR